MWKIVILAATSVSADLVKLWFQGELLAILFFGFSFFLVMLGMGGTAFPLSISCCWDLSLSLLTWFLELMGFRRHLPLMYVFPSGAHTMYELPSVLFCRTVTLVTHLLLRSHLLVAV